MSTCAACGGDLTQDWKFCVHCGEPVAPRAVQPSAVQPTTAQPTALARPRFNRLAILALVLGCVGGALAIVFGHIALSQIPETGERGRRIALVGTVLGYFWLVVELVLYFLIVSRSGA